MKYPFPKFGEEKIRRMDRETMWINYKVKGNNLLWMGIISWLFH